MSVAVGRFEVGYGGGDEGVGVPCSAAKVGCEQEGREEGVDTMDEGGIVGD